MIDFYKTILHQELEKWLQDPRDNRVEISNDDGTSYVIETKDNQFVIVRTNAVNIAEHDLNVGNEDTSQCTD